MVACITSVVLATWMGCRTPPRPVDSVGFEATSLRRAFERVKGRGGMARLELLSGPADAWASRWELLRGAQHSIDATYFIVEDDVFGLAFLGHLVAKARAGVRVRLLVDGRGSLPLTSPLWGRDYLEVLVAAGGDVRVYNPPFDQLLTALIRATAVPVSAGTHHKMLVVDRRRAVTGGRNIGHTYFSDTAEDPTAVDDADVLVDGPHAVARIADAMQREWSSPRVRVLDADLVRASPKEDVLLMLYAAMDAWLRGSIPIGPSEQAVTALEAAALSNVKELPSREARDAARVFFHALAARTSLHGITPHRTGPQHTGEVRVVAATSRIVQPDDSATEALLRAISGARQSIMIESPYFVLTPRVFQALDDAERRGVSITVLTNSPLSSDNPPSQALFIDTWPELMARLLSLQIFVPADTRMLHAKRAVFDDDLTLIGTYNIDPFSAEMNSELVLCVWSKSFNAHNRRELVDTIVRRGLLEYRIARDASQRAVRHRSDHPHAGEVVVLFGPRDHTPPDLIDRLTTLKPVLLGLRSLWDFDVVVW